jgi:hypothetical protein
VQARLAGGLTSLARLAACSPKPTISEGGLILSCSVISRRKMSGGRSQQLLWPNQDNKSFPKKSFMIEHKGLTFCQQKASISIQDYN